MLEEGLEIARRADRVGVLPLAPLVRYTTKTLIKQAPNFQCWAHSVPQPPENIPQPEENAQWAQKAKYWKFVFGDGFH